MQMSPDMGVPGAMMSPELHDAISEANRLAVVASPTETPAEQDTPKFPAPCPRRSAARTHSGPTASMK
jgi:hypothetical protein